MSAHFMIMGNAMETIKRIGGDPRILTTANPEHPEWECPICCLNWLSDKHDRICTYKECAKPKGEQFDNWIAFAADAVVKQWKAFNE